MTGTGQLKQYSDNELALINVINQATNNTNGQLVDWFV